MRTIVGFVCLVLAMLAAPSLAQDEALPPEAQEFLASLSPQSGTVALPTAHVSLRLGDEYLFYDEADARRILVDAWGNPPEQANGVLGLIMPAGSTPLSDAWGAVVSYEETGHVADDDAAEADYDEIITSMQDGAAEENAARAEAGYPAVNVVGWAQEPHYDPASHSVVWAREISFAGEPVNSLNYDLRTLGRTGVLSINLISQMPNLADIRVAANDLAQVASFQPGQTYEDFDSDTDAMADYGLAGLIAGGVAVGAAKKLGILALLLKFMKPLLIAIVVGFAAFKNRIMRLFGMGQTQEQAWEDYQAPDVDLTAGDQGGTVGSPDQSGRDQPPG